MKLTIDVDHFSGLVVNNPFALHPVGHLGTAQHPDFRTAGEREQLLLVVESHMFGFTFDVFVQAFALLPEKHTLPGCGPQLGLLLAFDFFPHFQPLGPQHQGALGGLDAAGEEGQSLLFIMIRPIRFDLHGLIAVSPFGHRWRMGQ